MAAVFSEGLETCVLCNKPTVDSRVCAACRTQTPLRHVWMAATYEGIAKKLIRAYKFERLRAAYKPLAVAMAETLPYFEDIVVVHIPTAPRRVRQRGYDQAKLLAHEIAKQRGWTHLSLLRRRHSLRQVGASRRQRMRQASAAFEVAPGAAIKGRHVLLVDDVTTSGATLLAAAELVMCAGAAQVDAVVAAKHTLEQP